MVDQLSNEYEKLSNKVRFIQEVLSDQLVVNNRKKLRSICAAVFVLCLFFLFAHVLSHRNELLQELSKRGYRVFSKTASVAADKVAEEGEELAEEEATDDVCNTRTHTYLMFCVC